MQVVPGPGGYGSAIRGRAGCKPAVYMDGMPIQNGADDIDQIMSSADVMAVEVYRGVATPVQFARGGCGAVLMWTKR